MIKHQLIFTLLLTFLVATSSPAVATSIIIDGQGKPSSTGQVLGNHSQAKPAAADQPSLDTDIEFSNSGQERKSQVSNQNEKRNSNAAENRRNQPEDIETIRVNPGQEKLQLRYEDENQELLHVDLESEVDEIEIEEPDYKTKTTLRTKNNANYVIRNKIAAQSNFPLQVNLETNELIVTTPKGSKTVTVLPDKAVENMLAANVLDQLGGKGGLMWLEEQRRATDSADLVDDNDATPSSDLEDGDNATDAADLEEEATDSGDIEVETETVVVDEADTIVELDETEDGTLVYKIQGSKTERILGLRRIQLNRVVVVSAETGELIEIDQNLLTDILDLISF